MQLRQLDLKNFRACRDTTVRLAEDLTVLVGENASGKSAIIDALRLATFPATGRQTAWFAADADLSFNVQRGTPVELSVTYGYLSETEEAVYLAALLDDSDELTYTASFATGPEVSRRNTLSWSVGKVRAEDPEPALRRRIAHVYLPPLRDAVRDLDGGEQSQLHDVLKLLLGADADGERQFLSAANKALDDVAQHPAATESRDAIQGYFSQTTPPNREHRLELNRRDLELRRIARLLRLQLAENDVPVGDIASTGLGYANLLYVSMVVLQLAKASDSDLTLLLVEEPEAHLHPQLQLVLLDFLQNQSKVSGQHSDTLRPAGKVQVVVTTHSPLLASAVSLTHVEVVARDSGADGWCTKATALEELALKPSDVRKIDRYLNSTRAALLFARDVVLVEGIAELLLLPTLARYRLKSIAVSAPGQSDDAGSDQIVRDTSSETGRPGETARNSAADRRRAERQFSSATIVSVEGVDFEPYLHLLLDGDHPRVDRVVVITDRDHTGAGDQRKASYEALFRDAVTSGRLVVEVGGTTLEAEIFRESANEPLLKKAFLELHPQSEAHWQKVADAADGQEQQVRAETFAKAIRATSLSEDLYLDIGKGDFAHIVAEAIDTAGSDALIVPGYLARAIDAVAHIAPARP
jgi:putative ATP-dependent endonuclease of OLD family